MGRWRGFLDSLDSDGGHILVLMAVLIGGVVLNIRGYMDGTTLVAGSFGALLTLLKDAGSNREQFGPPSTTVTTQTSQEAK